MPGAALHSRFAAAPSKVPLLLRLAGMWPMERGLREDLALMGELSWNLHFVSTSRAPDSPLLSPPARTAPDPSLEQRGVKTLS